MSNLGITSDEMYGPPLSTGAKPDKEIRFPNFDLKAKQIKAAGLGDCQVGDKYTAQVEFTITSMRDSGKNDKTLGLDFTNISDVEEAGESKQDKKDSDALGYDVKNVKKKKAMGVKDMPEPDQKDESDDITDEEGGE